MHQPAAVPPAGPDQTIRSSLIEKALEYRFLAELSAELLGRGWPFEVMRPDVDRDGYDLAIGANGVLRHIQLKGVIEGGKRAHVTVNTALADKPSPCLVWMVYQPGTLDLVSFRWFGGLPGRAMPCPGERVAPHSKANALGIKAERPTHRVVVAARFGKVGSIGELADRLFGPADEPAMLLGHMAWLGERDGPDWLAEVRAGNFAAIPVEIGWSSSAELAMLVDGYQLLGAPRVEDADAFLQGALDHALSTGAWRGGPIELWTSLFLEHRRWRQSSPFGPEPDHQRLLDRLVTQLRDALTGSG